MGEWPERPSETAWLISNGADILAMEMAALSPSQKTEVLRRQAFECAQCQTDLEPVGKAPPHFSHIGEQDKKGSSVTSDVRALCPSCHAMRPATHDKAPAEKERRQREAGSNRNAKKLVKSGFDMKKF